MTTLHETPWGDWTGGLHAAVPDPQMRVSDAERGEVADALSRHYADGRLDKAEFDARLQQAMTATTRSDLAPLLVDLPSAVAVAPADPPVRPRRVLPPVAVVVIVLIVAHTLAVMFPAHIPWIVFGIVAAILVRRSRRSSRPGRGWRRRSSSS